LIRNDCLVNEDFALHAWTDESMQFPQRSGGIGYYLLAAAVADPAACTPIRDSMRELVLSGATRLHWRDESGPRRAKIASAIGGHDLANLVIVGAPVDPRRQERARRLCMERLIHELGDAVQEIDIAI
jgi:hypothetical protein